MSGLPIPTFLQSEGFVTLLAALSALLTVAAVWRGLLDAKPLSGRLKELERRRNVLRQGLAAPTRRPAPARSAGLMRPLVGRLNLMGDGAAAGVAASLGLAGSRRKDERV